MTRATRTLNPLHFEDLEPHRFEDLIRQLAYDFRDWSSIEAVGRLGSDEGIDIRATLSSAVAAPVEDEDLDLLDRESTTEPQTWIIQCKRERSIGPRKIRGIAVNDLSQQAQAPYGYIVAAACDFSKKTRDAFRETMAEYRIEEFYLWGKAEIEDMLFLPKNDHLLFAYFGISLQVKRRSQRTQVRSLLAQKREAIRKLGSLEEQITDPVLIRSVDDERYFERDEGDLLYPGVRHWELYHQHPLGLIFTLRKYFAHYDSDSGEWDFIPDYDHAVPHPMGRDPSKAEFENQKKYSYCSQFFERTVPRDKRAWYYETTLIPFTRILAIDEVGDVWNKPPHLIVEPNSNNELFDEKIVKVLLPSYYGGQAELIDGLSRVSFFPVPIPLTLDEDGEQPEV